MTIQDTPTPGTWTNPVTIAAQASESTDEPATTGRAPNAARAATREPTTVTTATTGAASTLAGTATHDTSPESNTSTGDTASCAATATARASAAGGGIRADHIRVHGGTKRTMPAVARTDRANP